MRILFGFFLALGLAGAALAQGVDRSDPAMVATRFVDAYKARDLAAMAPLMDANNADFFAELAAEGRAHPAYGRVFSGWRADAIDAANGVSGAARVRREGEVWVPIGQSGGEIFVVALTAEENGWGVEDILSPGAADFDVLPIAR
ncbi:hypothetical protein DLJ53_15285 [Acuticoccus sediminis]|uniref:DUF3828 domain-containing protein n=1 Tax=Acuticoccus sediminis TaxID=2184697 RepID=A0A8B2NRC4_9HYPH|nr:hypothetical protein [Acuticoccus sediminis]RAI00619.1 hypothetical protein DLJ53_15285 [Acuticoccus sediminis]